MRVTFSVIKADIGSIGGHTQPSKAMFERGKARVAEAVSNNLLLDGMVTYTGDDVALIMSHTHGDTAPAIHNFAWDTFLILADIAKQEGNYGAGQDLLADAPSGNVRGAGPACAEIEFDLLPEHRPAEALMVFAGDKCAPGMYNLPLYLTFCDPMHNSGLLLSPVLHQGFTFTVIDMDHTAENLDRVGGHLHGDTRHFRSVADAGFTLVHRCIYRAESKCCRVQAKAGVGNRSGRFSQCFSSLCRD